VVIEFGASNIADGLDRRSLPAAMAGIRWKTSSHRGRHPRLAALRPHRRKTVGNLNRSNVDSNPLRRGELIRRAMRCATTIEVRVAFVACAQMCGSSVAPKRGRFQERRRTLEIDWKMLRHNAVGVMRNAYAPYSNFPVGAAGLTETGGIVYGCNVENVSYGLGLCAETVLVGNHQSNGGGRLIAVSVSDARGMVLLPCGRCRQILYEFGGAGLLVDHPDGPARLGFLLPDAFGPDDLDAAGPAGQGGR